MPSALFACPPSSRTDSRCEPVRTRVPPPASPPGHPASPLPSCSRRRSPTAHSASPTRWHALYRGTEPRGGSPSARGPTPHRPPRGSDPPHRPATTSSATIPCLDSTTGSPGRRRLRRMAHARRTTVDCVQRLLPRAPRTRAERWLQPGPGVLGARPTGGLETRWEVTTTPGEQPDRGSPARRRAGGRRPLLEQGGVPRRYAEPDKGGPTGTRPAGRRRSGTWMPRWPVCRPCRPPSTRSRRLLLGVPRVRRRRARAFGIPADFDPVGAITMAHRVEETAPSGSPTARRRKPQEDVVQGPLGPPPPVPAGVVRRHHRASRVRDRSPRQCTVWHRTRPHELGSSRRPHRGSCVPSGTSLRP